MSAARSIVPLALSLFILLIPAADGTPFQDNCTKIVQIPLAVNIINSAAKPNGNPVNSDYIRDFVKSLNEIYRQACVEFMLLKINNLSITGSPDDPEVRKAIRDEARKELGNIESFKNGAGAKISIVNGLGSSGGVAVLGDLRSIIVDTKRTFPDKSSLNVSDDTWAHEMKHGFGYSHSDAANRNDIIAPGVEIVTDEMGNFIEYRIYRTGTEMSDDEKKEINEKSQKFGKSLKLKSPPIKVHVKRNRSTDPLYDVFYIPNSTIAHGYGFIDINEVFLFSEIPFTHYHFTLSFEEIPFSAQTNITIRIMVDSDSLPGYERTALLNLSGFPFNGKSAVKVTDSSGNVTPGSADVTTTINYELIDAEDLLFIPLTFGYDLSFNISSNILGISNSRSRVLVQVDYAQAQVRDEVIIRIYEPDKIPLINAEPFNVSDNVTITGAWFSPETDVVLFIDGIQVVTARTDSNGNFSIKVPKPDLVEGLYTVTAVDDALLSDYTVIYIVSGETVQDSIDDDLEKIVSKYYLAFDWRTQTPARHDVLQAVINAVIAYFSTSDSASKEEVLNDVVQLVG